MRKPLLLTMILIAMLVLVACDSDSDSEAETPPEPEALIADAVAALDAAQTFQLVLSTSGAPVLLDASNVGLDADIALQNANGVFVRPDALGGTVAVTIDDIVAEVEIVLIGDDQYIRHQLITLGSWQQMTFLDNFDPANLVSGEDSIQQALGTIQNLTYVGREDLDGLPMHHLRGEVEAVQVQAVTVGLIGTESGMIAVDVYLRTSDNRLEQLVLQEPILEGNTEPTTWTIGLYDYDGEYTVTRPKLSGD